MAPNPILITAAALREKLDEPGYVIVDCRCCLSDVDEGRRLYEQSHLPGALYLDLDRDLAGPVTATTGRHPLPNVDVISARLGDLGIARSDTVVVYDGGNGSIAARAWWVLRWLGQRSIRLLDGGFEHWCTRKLPLQTSRPERAPVDYVPDADSAMELTTAELAADLAGIPGLRLLDARDRPRFDGQLEPIDPVAGHIPGAVNLPFVDFLNADGTWKPLPERCTLLERALGTDREIAWSVMCGSGVTACHLAISGLEAGFREPRLYVGSWSEWIRDPERPVDTNSGRDFGLLPADLA